MRATPAEMLRVSLACSEPQCRFTLSVSGASVQLDAAATIPDVGYGTNEAALEAV